MGCSEAPIVVKLGGSLITELRDNGPVLAREAVHNLATELAQLPRPLVLLHGTGAYGKPPALRYGYSEGKLGPEQADIVALVQHQLDFLSFQVAELLIASGLPVFVLRAAALVDTAAHSIGGLSNAVLAHHLAQRRVVPLIAGGFVCTPTGFRPYSSDDIAADLAIAFGAQALIYCTAAHGVEKNTPDDAQAFFADLHPHEPELQSAIRANPQDISGSMGGKLQTAFRAAAAGVRTMIIDGRVIGNLRAAIDGRDCLGTRIHAAALLVEG